MQVSIKDLENYKIYVAKAIQSRADGEFYIPIFERLEREINDRRQNLDTMSRIRAIANMG
ncbi:hypothetical protein RUA8715_02275 [Ruegeria arenilitoris]|uniref:Uncharacterized protein n=1 Tax=Ruegeria arenilitoris TaxID=1173585 RepID=A0A238KLY7_9RHOB|nr:hypothetical protein RUA8715_02275 [Ruegeria arenilitoris]